MCDREEPEINGLQGRTPQPPPELWGAEYRRQLLLHNRERVEFAYEKARRQGIEDPVILVLDLQDDRAARLAQQTGLDWALIERWRAECARCDVVPTQVISAPRWAVMCVVGPTTPNSPQGIAKPNAADTFRVVAIAAGGNSFADFPVPPSSAVSESEPW